MRVSIVWHPFFPTISIYLAISTRAAATFVLLKHQGEEKKRERESWASRQESNCTTPIPFWCNRRHWLEAPVFVLRRFVKFLSSKRGCNIQYVMLGTIWQISFSFFWFRFRSSWGGGTSASREIAPLLRSNQSTSQCRNAAGGFTKRISRFSAADPDFQIEWNTTSMYKRSQQSNENPHLFPQTGNPNVGCRHTEESHNDAQPADSKTRGKNI